MQINRTLVVVGMWCALAGQQSWSDDGYRRADEQLTVGPVSNSVSGGRSSHDPNLDEATFFFKPKVQKSRKRDLRSAEPTANSIEPASRDSTRETIITADWNEPPLTDTSRARPVIRGQAESPVLSMESQDLSMLDPVTDIAVDPLSSSSMMAVDTSGISVVEVEDLDACMDDPPAVQQPTFQPEPVYAAQHDNQSANAAFWARGEVLLWFMEGLNSGPLAAVNPVGTPGTSAGILSNPSTRPLFGDNLGDDLRVGGRFQFGRWLGCGNCRAIQGDFFWLGSPGSGFNSRNVPTGILSRPFTNTDIGGEDSQIFQMAGLADGSLTSDFSSELWSGGIGLRRQLGCCSPPCNPCSVNRLDMIYGYRYMHLGETFRAQEILMPTGPGFVPGTTLTLDDEIRTENDFHGFEFGLSSMSLRGRWTSEVSSLVAIGQVRNQVRLNGSTNSFVPGVANETVDGGFIVAPEMIGSGETRRLGVVPQARLNIGYFLTRNLRLTAGYNFLYFYQVVRPDSYLDVVRSGASIARGVPAVVPRTDVPTPADGVWLHGASLGFTLTY